MVDRILGAHDAGIYAAVTRTGILVGFGALAVYAMVTPMIARLYSVNKTAELKRVLTFACWAVVGVGIPVAVGLIALSSHILGLFGTDFRLGAPALRVFASGQVLVVAMGLAGPLLNMTGHERTVAASLVVAVVANIMLNWIFISRFGLEGAAGATIIVKVLWHLFLVWWIHRRLEINWAALLLRWPIYRSTRGHLVIRI